MPVTEQSALPKYRGLPWWGAVAFAVVSTAIGATVDAMRVDALATTYQVLYLIGCVGAALLVRRRALFTAAVQPPLIALVVSVITLYALTSGVQMSAKTLIFKLALPIASSFPSMAVTFALTLAVVVARWFITRGQTPSSQPRSAKSPAPKRPQRPAKPSAESGSQRPRPRPNGPGEGARRAATLSENERRTVPTRRRAEGAPAPGRRRADRAEAGSSTARSPEQRQQRPRPRPQPSELAEDQARAARPRPPQQGPAVRRTAGAAARAAGLDLTADLGEDPAPRRRQS